MQVNWDHNLYIRLQQVVGSWIEHKKTNRKQTEIEKDERSGLVGYPKTKNQKQKYPRKRHCLYITFSEL